MERPASKSVQKHHPRSRDLNLPGPLIFDIGCHTGEDSDFYLRKGFTVVAVEANPALCVRLKQRFANQISEGRFFLIEKAIAERTGEVTFFINVDATIWGTIREDWARRNARRGTRSEKITVPSIRFSSLIEGIWRSSLSQDRYRRRRLALSRGTTAV